MDFREFDKIFELCYFIFSGGNYLPTLKERVERLEIGIENINDTLEGLEELSGLTPDNIIRKVEEETEGVIERTREKIKEIIEERIEKLEKNKSDLPEILTEFCEIFEEELGLNYLVSLRKKIDSL